MRVNSKELRVIWMRDQSISEIWSFIKGLTFNVELKVANFPEAKSKESLSQGQSLESQIF